MRYLNKVTINGTIHSLEEAISDSGASICGIVLITKEIYKSREGEQKEDTNFYNLIMERPLTGGSYLKEGSFITVIGELLNIPLKDNDKSYESKIRVQSINASPCHNKNASSIPKVHLLGKIVKIKEQIAGPFPEQKISLETSKATYDSQGELRAPATIHDITYYHKSSFVPHFKEGDNLNIQGVLTSTSCYDNDCNIYYQATVRPKTIEKQTIKNIKL